MVLAFGIITALIGIVALAWPGRTLLVVAVLFGIQLIAMGIFRFAAAFASDDASGGTRVLLALLGVLSLIIGLYAVRHVLRRGGTVHGAVAPRDAPRAPGGGSGALVLYSLATTTADRSPDRSSGRIMLSVSLESTTRKTILSWSAPLLAITLGTGTCSLRDYG
ncbi:MAG TPA: DUF308 domain-containing protein [Streptosporangiaceae bacterium]|nr:DUF308 domain-containing protein [Streptosporangiaceae bacterium]